MILYDRSRQIKRQRKSFSFNNSNYFEITSDYTEREISSRLNKIDNLYLEALGRFKVYFGKKADNNLGPNKMKKFHEFICTHESIEKKLDNTDNKYLSCKYIREHCINLLLRLKNLRKYRHKFYTK